MKQKEMALIEAALFQQRVTVRRTPNGYLVFRKDGQTMAFLMADAGLIELHTLLNDLARRGHILWPPDW